MAGWIYDVTELPNQWEATSIIHQEEQPTDLSIAPEVEFLMAQNRYLY